ncbi:MAG TPA: HD domain-containing protein [Candidatus Methanofastidiosa archaeon]|nr:HD domain-containing protein [Candidatus Methanofastidiosa archaeon]
MGVIISRYKIIHDVVHGSIKLDGFMLELVQTPEINRLHNIKQLGLVYLVFPGAQHTRFEHSMGVSYISDRIAQELKIDEGERDLVRAAGFLHDIGHGPYSHTLEYIFHDILGQDHMEITKDIITGKHDIMDGIEQYLDYRPIPSILEDYGLDPKEVADLVTGSSDNAGYSLFNVSESGQQFFNDRKYLAQIIHGSIDADQLDYLIRDSYYTGVAHGTVDLDRLLKTVEIFNNDLIIHRKGVPAVEGMLVARALMYSSVYFHKTARIAETMLARAVELSLDSDDEDILSMMDMELLKWLEGKSEIGREMVYRIKYRNLYKKAFVLDFEQLSEDQRHMLSESAPPRERKRLEEEICRKAGIPVGKAFIDIPAPELLISEPRLTKTNVKILDENKVYTLPKFSPLANALRKRPVTNWAMMVFCDGRYNNQVSKVAERLFQ